MKVRNGFVSNSSSSSFVIIITEKGVEQLKNSLSNQFQNQFVEEIVNSLFEKKKLENNTIFTFSENNSQGYNSNEDLFTELAKDFSEKFNLDYDDVLGFLFEFSYTLEKEIPEDQCIISKSDW